MATPSSVPPLTPVASPPRPPQVARTPWIDHLRVALTMLVVLHHVAIAYGGSGSWYWQERANASSLPLILFNAVNQSFFMGFFFLLAGYYTPPAYARKGARRFLSERFLRLGVPWLGYFLVLSPLTIALARTASGESFLAALSVVVSEGGFEPGPLWFAQALLVLAVGYALWRGVRRAPAGSAPPCLPRPATILVGLLAMGAANVLIRLWIPVGETVLWLQLGYFPAYVVLFAVGCRAAGGRWLEQVTWRDARIWLAVSVLLVAALPFVVQAAESVTDFVGGLEPEAIFYAFWDPFVAAGIILTLLVVARRHANASSPLLTWLARRAFGTFIVHPPVVVACSLALRGWEAAAVAKFVVVGFLSCAGSALAADLLLRLPGAKRIV